MGWDDQLAPGPAPLWFRIADRLRSAIVAGEFKPGDSLPSENELHAAFGVSRTTARASLDRLRGEGLISRQSGRGSIVLAKKVEQPANQLASFSEDMRRRGLAAGYITFSAGAAAVTPEAAEALDLLPDAQAFRIHRLLLADGEPMGLSESWLSVAALGGGTPPTQQDLEAGSLYLWLRDHGGPRIAGAQEFIEAAVADLGLSRHLWVPPGAPLLVARRRSHAADGTPLEYAVMHYRADRYRFSIDLTRSER